jgi:hypothetical protein
MRHCSDQERRNRIAMRHGLAPAARLDGPAEVTRAMTVLHATLPSTVYLSCWARARPLAAEDVDRALYEERTIVRQLAMRRTLFVFPRDLLAAACGSASARVAETQRKRMAKDLVAAGLADDGDAWLEGAREEVLEVLGRRPEGASALELREEAPRMAMKVAPPKGEGWSGSRVLTWLGARADVLRGVYLGDRWGARPRWTLPRDWLGEEIDPCDAATGYRELVRRWLRTFGPGTEEDIVWWLGSTKSAVREALGALEAVEVSLERGGPGWLLPDDLAEAEDPGRWVALLPVLDPSVMGWRERGFYLGPHAAALFDRSGNAGTTAWVDGRIVGCWVQDEAAVVRPVLLEEVDAEATEALHAEAARLTEWLGGVRIAAPLRSPAMLAATGRG